MDGSASPTAESTLIASAGVTCITVDTGRRVLAGCQDGSICLGDAVEACRDEMLTLQRGVHGGGVSALALNTSGTMLASAGVDGRVNVWSFVDSDLSMLINLRLDQGEGM